MILKLKVKYMSKLLYSLLFFLVFNTNLYTQIIYTDISDATPNASYSLDLNNDTIVDFILQYGGSSDAIGVLCYPQNNNAYAGNFLNGNYLPWALPASSTICPSLANWYDANNPGTLGWGTNQGYWVGETDKYLALKLIVGTNTYYGWARIDLVATSSSFTLKDYAYQGTQNTCILAGQTNLGNPKNSIKNSVSIYPNPMITSATIQTNYPLNNATLTVYNTHGQTVNQVTNISGYDIIISRENLQNGLYFIHLTEDNTTIAVEKLQISEGHN
jgi:hypothetical protein